jgi:DNA polymerase-3 subunit chi
MTNTIAIKPYIDFHVLSKPSYIDNYVANIIEQFYSENFKILIATPSLALSQEIDAYLWCYRPDSFLPHLIIEENESEAPILISHTTVPTGHIDILVNLRKETSKEYLKFDRIIEFVLSDEKAKQLSRQKYQSYIQWGFEINTKHQN